MSGHSHHIVLYDAYCFLKQFLQCIGTYTYFVVVVDVDFKEALDNVSYYFIVTSIEITSKNDRLSGERSVIKGD